MSAVSQERVRINQRLNLRLNYHSSIGLILNLQQHALVCNYNERPAKSDTPLYTTLGLLLLLTKGSFPLLINNELLRALVDLHRKLGLILFYLRQLSEGLS